MLAEGAASGITVTNEHEGYAVLAVQGPRSSDVLAALDLPVDLDYLSFVDAASPWRPVTVCRTGYTGEHGYELLPRWANAADVWDALVPVGHRTRWAGRRARCPRHLAHRDGIPAPRARPLALHLAGPSAARVGRGLGQAAVPGPRRPCRRTSRRPEPAAVGTEGDGPRDPAPSHAGYRDDGVVVGEVTSGTFSPTLRQGIGLRPAARRSEGDLVTVDVRGRPSQMRVVKPPFVAASTPDRHAWAQAQANQHSEGEERAVSTSGAEHVAGDPTQSPNGTSAGEPVPPRCEPARPDDRMAGGRSASSSSHTQRRGAADTARTSSAAAGRRAPATVAPSPPVAPQQRRGGKPPPQRWQPETTADHQPAQRAAADGRGEGTVLDEEDEHDGDHPERPDVRPSHHLQGAPGVRRLPSPSAVSASPSRCRPRVSDGEVATASDRGQHRFRRDA